MKGDRTTEISILVLCLLVGIFLRYYTFDRKSLWIDEVHTYNDSRYGLKEQLEYLKGNPDDVIHPPFFFVITHVFFPFPKPERDLRIFPLLFGMLAIPMMYLLSRRFSSGIAIPCTLSLTFMTYHISLSQDGRPYSIQMFLGMAGLYFLLRYIQKAKKKDALIGAAFFAFSFYISYSTIPFIIFSQILWFYQRDERAGRLSYPSLLFFNGALLLLALPWVLFFFLHYGGQPSTGRFLEELGSLGTILSGIFNDWVPFWPLTVISIAVLALFTVISRQRRNALLLLGSFMLPIILLYLFCRLLNIQHFFSSKYLINFLPLFLISVFLGLEQIETRFGSLKKILSMKTLFALLFIASNVVILPLYYRAEKQDFRSLVAYLNGNLRDGDAVFVGPYAYIPGILHYFGVFPEKHHYSFPINWVDRKKGEYEVIVPLTRGDVKFTICYSNSCCARYMTENSRLWVVVVGKPDLQEMRKNASFVFKGYFDGSFSNFRRFPSDASMYLFLWDPESPGRGGLDLPRD